MVALRQALLATLLAGSAHTSGPGLRALCLQPKDVGHGFVLKVSKDVPNTTVAGVMQVPATVLSKDVGRIDGYETVLTRNPDRGLYYINDIVHRFRSPRGAETFLGLEGAGILHLVRYGAHYKSIHAARVGNHSLAFEGTFRANGLSYTGVIVYFRQGTLDGTVGVDGFSGTYTPGQIVALAEALDGRFKAEPGH